MVSNSSHTNHEFLILVIRVTNVSFGIESFVTYEKVSIMMLHMKRIFLLLTFFYSLMWRIYFKLSYEKFCEKTGRKNVTKSLKNTRKG